VGTGKAILRTPPPAHGCRAQLAVLTVGRNELYLLPLKAATKLAKPRLDIGFATNNAPAALEFWRSGADFRDRLTAQ
jgi:hypothetical protein